MQGTFLIYSAHFCSVCILYIVSGSKRYAVNFCLERYSLSKNFPIKKKSTYQTWEVKGIICSAEESFW